MLMLKIREMKANSDVSNWFELENLCNLTIKTVLYVESDRCKVQKSVNNECESTYVVGAIRSDFSTTSKPIKIVHTGKGYL